MRSIFVNEDASLVVEIKSIASDMRTFVANQYFLVGAGGESFSQHTSCKSSSYDQIVKHDFPLFVL